MDHPITSDSSNPSAPTLPRRGVPVDAGLNRFSPLSAPQREVVDAFCAENRPWALRQARRTYRHLPDALREQAVDRALTELRTRAPQSLERRALACELADRLTEALRHVHVGWCLNESSALLRREGTEPVQPEVRRDDLAAFVDDGLGGLERAVLQLEIGAGRDTRTSRAALRLGPRQYAAHRENGLSKLRDAISAQVIGRACDQHVSGIVAAATGDRAAMESLSAGPYRCRYCAREAQGLRSVLHERLAVAPWPIAVKPAGLLAAKLGVLGTVFGSKAGVGGAGALGVASGSGASAAATVLAAAALATGTAAVVGDDGSKRDRANQAKPTAAAVAAPATGAAKSAAAAGKPAAKKSRAATAGKAKVRPNRAQRRKAVRRKAGSTPAATTPTTTTTSSGTTTTAAAPTSGSGSGSGPVSSATKPVTDAVKGVTDNVTSTLPPVVAAPVDQTLDTVTDTVDGVTGAVDGLLKP